MTRHPLDALSLQFGALFIAIGLVLLTGTVDSISLTWAGPLVAIGLGIMIIFGARQRRPETEPTAED